MNTPHWAAGAVLGVPLAIDAAGAELLAECVHSAAPGPRLTAFFGSSSGGKKERPRGRIALRGLVLPAADRGMRFWGVEHTGLDELARELAEDLADESVREIVLEVDSPGGVAQGVSAVAQAIRAARDVKPVYAYVGGRCCSAAMWLASQATQIYASPDSLVGSLGVMRVLRDSSKAAEKRGVEVHLLRSGPLKGTGTPGVEVSAEEIASAQAVVDGLASMFESDLKAGRPDLDVASAFTGAVWLASDAPAGLVDSAPKHSSLPAGGTTQAQQANEDPMTTSAPGLVPGPTPASLAELKALGGSPAFVLAQLEASATLPQAQLALARLQADEARAELDAANERHQAELTQVRAELETAQRNASRPGADPAHANGGTGSGGSAQIPSRFQGMSWKEAIRAYRDQTQPHNAGHAHRGLARAAKALDRAYPALREQLMQSWTRPTTGPWSENKSA